MSEKLLPQASPAEHVPPNESVTNEMAQVSSGMVQGEMTPYYTLDEDKIRSEIAAAFIGKPIEKVPIVYLAETPWGGRTDDIHKAEAQAYAMDPHKVAAKAKFQELEEMIASNYYVEYPTSLKGAVRKLGRVMSPWRFTKVTAKVAKLGWQTASLDQKAATTAQIVGEQYDKMVAAALPFKPKLDIPKSILNVLMPPVSEAGKAEEGPETETFTAATEELVEQLNMDAQLAEQAQIWSRAGISAQEYPLPNTDQLRRVVEKNEELIKFKASQGFTRLVLVPTDVPTAELTKGMKQRVSSHFKDNDLHTTDRAQSLYLSNDRAQHPAQWGSFMAGAGDVRDVGEDNSANDQQSNKKPKDRNDPDHSITPGWEIMLVKNMPEIPQQRKELVFFGGRPEFLPDAKPEAYLHYIETDPRLAVKVA